MLYRGSYFKSNLKIDTFFRKLQFSLQLHFSYSLFNLIYLHTYVQAYTWVTGIQHHTAQGGLRLTLHCYLNNQRKIEEPSMCWIIYTQIITELRTIGDALVVRDHWNDTIFLYLLITAFQSSLVLLVRYALYFTILLFAIQFFSQPLQRRL